MSDEIHLGKVSADVLKVLNGNYDVKVIQLDGDMDEDNILSEHSPNRILVDMKDKAAMVTIREVAHESTLADIKTMAEKHKNDNTPLGDLCGDILRDKRFPWDNGIHYQYEYVYYKTLDDSHMSDAFGTFCELCNYDRDILYGQE
jgi:hypothetical protein